MTNPGKADAVRAHRSEQWGETKNPDGAGRRIYVGNIPPRASVEEYRAHFGREAVEGVFVGDHYAFVQFKHQGPADYFTMKGFDHFLDRKVNIREYRVDERVKGKPRPSLSSYSSTSRALVPTTTSKRSRSRSKSPSRAWGDHDRERSSSSRQHRERHDERDRKRHHERHDSEPKHEHKSNRSRSSSSVTSRDHSDRSHHHRKKDDLAKRAESRDALRYRGMNDHHASWVEEKAPRWIEADKPIGSGEDELPELTMPYGVELVLKLALDQGSVRGLSVHQINEVIKFFESERDFIMQATGMSCNNNNSVQLPQPASMIEYSQPLEAASYPQIEPESQESQPPTSLETAEMPSIEQSTAEDEEVLPPVKKTESCRLKPESIRATAELIKLAFKPTG